MIIEDHLNYRVLYVYIQFGFLAVYASALIAFPLAFPANNIDSVNLLFAFFSVGISFVALLPAVPLFLWGLRLKRDYPADGNLNLAARIAIVPLLIFPISIGWLFIAIHWFVGSN